VEIHVGIHFPNVIQQVMGLGPFGAFVFAQDFLLDGLAAISYALLVLCQLQRVVDELLD
jgi:hypothetical protein